MTALEKYVRLEALGQWREGPGAAPREVVVSFGDATLVLTDLAERPLGHWALAGVQAVGRDGPATVYAMTRDGAETLTIRDADMVEAIAAVSRAHRLRDPEPPAPPRRSWAPWALAAAALAALAAAGPPLVAAQAARMMPPEAVEEFGDRMLLQLMAARGPLCGDADGRRALATLAATVAQGSPARLRALDLGGAPAALLPGPTVALDRAALAQADDPAEVAGWIALALSREAMRPGPERLAAAVGPAAALRYVLTGELSEAALARATRAALSSPEPEEILAAYERLRTAGLATGPFADGLRRAGVEAPPGTAEGAAALSDRDWVALQGLCG
jgi:hypothetical protein